MDLESVRTLTLVIERKSFAKGSGRNERIANIGLMLIKIESND